MNGGQLTGLHFGSPAVVPGGILLLHVSSTTSEHGLSRPMSTSTAFTYLHHLLSGGNIMFTCCPSGSITLLLWRNYSSSSSSSNSISHIISNVSTKREVPQISQLAIHHWRR